MPNKLEIEHHVELDRTSHTINTATFKYSVDDPTEEIVEAKLQMIKDACEAVFPDKE